MKRDQVVKQTNRIADSIVNIVSSAATFAKDVVPPAFDIYESTQGIVNEPEKKKVRSKSGKRTKSTSEKVTEGE